MKKRLLSLTLAAAMVLSMAGCRGAEPAATTAAPAETEATTAADAADTKAEEGDSAETEASGTGRELQDRYYHRYGFPGR